MSVTLSQTTCEKMKMRCRNTTIKIWRLPPHCLVVNSSKTVQLVIDPHSTPLPPSHTTHQKLCSAGGEVFRKQHHQRPGMPNSLIQDHQVGTSQNALPQAAPSDERLPQGAHPSSPVHLLRHCVVAHILCPH